MEWTDKNQEIFDGITDNLEQLNKLGWVSNYGREQIHKILQEELNKAKGQ